MELHKNDQLSREELPEETLKEILNHIKSIDGGAVQRVYLLRKTVSETMSGSIFILDFLHDMKQDQCYDILDQVRRYLDSLGHWQYMVYAYKDVKKVRPEKIPGSLVYENKEWQEYGKKPE